MKPTQEKILSSIQENKSKKELLSVQKVDLTFVQDSEKLEKLYFKLLDDEASDMKRIQEGLSGLLGLESQFERVVKEANTIYTKGYKAAKELGVDPEKIFDSLQNVLDNGTSNLKAIKSNISKLKSLI